MPLVGVGGAAYIGGMKHLIPFLKSRPYVPVIRLQGMISASSRLGGAPLSDAALAPVIERAFGRGRPAAVALIINSPGGSPVQSALIAARIRRLAEAKKVPVHAFVEDLAASGGYWLATAADDIWCDASSIIGSVGVISSGFGFTELLARHGVERRVHAAGKSKSFLDPFQPEKPADVKRLKALQEPIHEAFIAQVRARRGTRLGKGDLFTGDVWTGAEAVALGLADGIAHLVPKLQSLYGEKVRMVPLGPRRRFWQRFGAQLAADALEVAEERALWARFGM